MILISGALVTTFAVLFLNKGEATKVFIQYSTIYPSIYLSFYLSILISIQPSIYTMYIYVTMYLSIYYLISGALDTTFAVLFLNKGEATKVSIYPSIYPSFYLFILLFILCKYVSIYLLSNKW